jgi:hydroxymethylglutaryl-CoA reductase
MNKGAKEVSCKIIDTDFGKMLIVELLIDVGDAMGANVTNTMCEAVSPLLEKITGGRTLLRILSNYSTRRIAKATAVFDKNEIGGENVVNDIVLAYQFADNDVYRAVTHNKGIMNGIIAVANATGQDSRAIEAAANAYAARSGKYRSLSNWTKDNNGNLVGSLELPLSVGIVGGIANVHPIAKICMKILKVTSAQELACIMIATGLAQNYSAIRALSTEGIQKGHMRLHARNLAAAAGAKPDQIDKIVQKMIEEKKISLDKAKEILLSLD